MEGRCRGLVISRSLMEGLLQGDYQIEGIDKYFENDYNFIDIGVEGKLQFT